MEWPPSAPRPHIPCAQGSLESCRRGEHFAHNMCRLRLRAPAVSGGNHHFATSFSIPSAIATPFLPARSHVRVGPTVTNRPLPRTRFFAAAAHAQGSIRTPTDLFGQMTWHLHLAGKMRQ